MCPPAKETPTRQQLRSLSMQELGWHWPITYAQETAKTELNTQKQRWSMRGREIMQNPCTSKQASSQGRTTQHNTKETATINVNCSCRQTLLNHAKEKTSHTCRATRQSSDNPQRQQWRLASQSKTERTAKEGQLFQQSKTEEPTKIQQRINAKQRIHADTAQPWRDNASQSCNDTELPPCREEDNPSSLNPECMSHAGTYWRILRINHEHQTQGECKNQKGGPDKKLLYVNFHVWQQYSMHAQTINFSLMQAKQTKEPQANKRDGTG